MEKREIKISFGTLIASIIAIILLIAVACMGIYIVMKNNYENTKVDTMKEEIKQEQIAEKNTKNNVKTTTPVPTQQETNTVPTNTQTNNENVKKATNNEQRKKYILETASKHGESILPADIDYNLSLENKIDEAKNGNNVSNYASVMNWSTAENSALKFLYPTDWKIEKPNNGIESYRISGKAIGRQWIGDNARGDKVVEQDVVIVVFEPVIFKEEDMSKVTWKDDGYNGLGMGIPEEVWWTSVSLESNNVYVEDYYIFKDNTDGTKTLIKCRIAYPSGEPSTIKTRNIINYFIGEATLK